MGGVKLRYSRRIDYGEDGHEDLFQLNHAASGRAMGDMSCTYEPSYNHLNVNGIYGWKGDPNRSKHGVVGQHQFGPTHIRSILKQLKQHYPEMKSIGGTRVSGIRTVSGAGAEHAHVDLKKAIDSDPKYTLSFKGDSHFGPEWNKNFHIMSGGKMVGHLSSYFDSETGHVHVGDIGLYGRERDNANKVGPADVRGMLGQLKEHFPKMRSIGGYRVTGSRTGVAGSGAGSVRVGLKKSIDHNAKPMLKAFDSFAHKKLGLSSSSKGTCENFDRSKYTVHDFHIQDKDTGEIHGGLSTHVDHSQPEVVHVSSIWANSQGEFSGYSRNHADSAGKMGNGNVRSLMRDLKQHYPEMKKISGERVTGIHMRNTSRRGRKITKDVRKAITGGVKLERTYMGRSHNFGYGEQSEHQFDVKDEAGVVHAKVETTYNHDKKNIHVDGMWPHSTTFFNEAGSFVSNLDRSHVGKLGPAHVRSIARQLKGYFPEAKTLDATRVSGVRSRAAGFDSHDPPTVKKDMWKSFSLNRAGSEFGGDRFNIIHDETGSVHGRLVGSFHPENNDFHVSSVRRYHRPDEPFSGDFDEYTRDGTRNLGNRFGPTHIRKLLGDLKQHYPDMKTISGTRVTGARKGPAGKDKYSDHNTVSHVEKSFSLKYSKDGSFGPTHRFQIVDDETGDVHGKVYGSYHPEENEFHVSVMRRYEEPNKEGYRVDPYSGQGSKALGNKFGPTHIRKLLGDLKQHFPEMKRVSGVRVTGSRVGPAARVPSHGTGEVELNKGLVLHKVHSYQAMGDVQDHDFEIKDEHTGAVHGQMGLAYNSDAKAIHVHGIVAYPKPDQPHNGQQYFGEAVKLGQHKIGATGIRSLLGQLKQHFPEMKSIEGTRVSGIRHGPASRPWASEHAEVKLRKSLHVRVDPEEKVYHPAIEVDGKVYTGDTHMQAMTAAGLSGVGRQQAFAAMLNHPTNGGFTTSHRPFIDRKLAYHVALQAGQLKSGVPRNRGEKGQLDSGDYTRPHDAPIPDYRTPKRAEGERGNGVDANALRTAFLTNIGKAFRRAG